MSRRAKIGTNVVSSYLRATRHSHAFTCPKILIIFYFFLNYSFWFIYFFNFSKKKFPFPKCNIRPPLYPSSSGTMGTETIWALTFVYSIRENKLIWALKLVYFSGFVTVISMQLKLILLILF